jgi:ABC-2 type transport system permease protein
MSGALHRIGALIVKEFLIILRDPRGRLILIFPPIFQLIVFSFAATLEVKNVPIMILNQDGGRHGHEIARRVGASKQFSKITFADREEIFTDALLRQEIMAAVRIPQDFSRRIEEGGGASLQVVYDGRKSNAAQISNGYLAAIVDQYIQELEGGRGRTIQTLERHWFNPNLDHIWTAIPSLAAILTLVITLSQSALSLAREKELGTFDQLLVTPCGPSEILIGKLVPAIIVGLLEALLIVALGRLLFGVPFRGSFLLLLAAILLFAFSVVGFGLFISALAGTQQQAVLGSFMFMVPAVSLSGFAAPVENMPPWLQGAAWINPMKHGLILFKGIFLKDLPLHEVAANAWPLAVIGAVSLLFSGWIFRRRLG